MALNLYFLRHGQTASSRANHFCGSGSNPELTADGQEMAQAFAECYHTTAWKAIYCSRLARAQATAAPLLAKTGIKPELRDQLREIDYGKWEGLDVAQVKQIYAADHASWSRDPARFAPSAGETAQQIAERVDEVIQEIRSAYSDGNVLIISHKATIRIALCSLLGIDLKGFRYRLACPVASLSILRFEEHGPMLETLADRSHLSRRLRELPGT